MSMSIIMAIIAAVSAIAGISANAITSAQQRKHDQDMANLNLENQKKLMDYEVELGQNTNTMATQKGQAAAAGFSPALLYGNMSTPSLVSPSGSASGSASSLPNLNMFDKVSMRDAVEPVLQKRYQDSQIQLMASEQSLNHQKELESAMRTAEQARYTNLQKSLERTIVDQAMANLHNTQVESSYLRSMTARIDATLPLELEGMGIINSQNAAKINQIVTDTLKSRAEMSLIGYERKRLAAMTELYEEESKTSRKDRDVMDAQIAGMQETFRNSAVGRIMRESGLAGLKMPPSQRGTQTTSPVWYQKHKPQIDGALIALKSLGFSDQEAAMAVIYYVSDSRDVSPSIINGFTRIASSLVKK